MWANNVNKIYWAIEGKKKHTFPIVDLSLRLYHSYCPFCEKPTGHKKGKAWVVVGEVSPRVRTFSFYGSGTIVPNSFPRKSEYWSFHPQRAGVSTLRRSISVKCKESWQTSWSLYTRDPTNPSLSIGDPTHLEMWLRQGKSIQTAHMHW